MKLILICWLAAIMPILHSANDNSTGHASIDSTAFPLHQLSGRNGDLTAFIENKILIKEFADIVEEHRRRLMSANGEDISKKELTNRVRVN